MTAAEACRGKPGIAGTCGPCVSGSACRCRALQGAHEHCAVRRRFPVPQIRSAAEERSEGEVVCVCSVYTATEAKKLQQNKINEATTAEKAPNARRAHARMRQVTARAHAGDCRISHGACKQLTYISGKQGR